MVPLAKLLSLSAFFAVARATEAGQMQDREICLAPIQLLKREGGRVEVPLQLSPNAVTYLQSRKGPIFPVAMLGVYRGGKSMLLNRLMLLKAPYTGGFGVGHSADTFTEGIYFCEEWINGLGTILWIDTEGLFSNRDTDSHDGDGGPLLDSKIATFALLMSSLLLLNNPGVFDKNFFDFFGIQQQHALILKDALAKSGISESGGLLPTGMKVYWVQSQPKSDEDVTQVFDKFKKKMPQQCQDEFVHDFCQIPFATNDVTFFNKLERVHDKELSETYKEATTKLREHILEDLHKSSRALQPGVIVKKMNMHLQVINQRMVDPSRTRSLFEEDKLDDLCNAGFKEAVQKQIKKGGLGDLSKYLERRQKVMKEAKEKRKQFGLDENWVKRVSECVQEREMEFVKQKWEKDVQDVEDKNTHRCFFLDEIDKLGHQYTMNPMFKESFERSAAKIRENARRLQITKLRECVVLSDITVPLGAWLIYPVIRLLQALAGIINHACPAYAKYVGAAAGILMLIRSLVSYVIPMPPLFGSWLDPNLKVFHYLPADWLLIMPHWMLSRAVHLGTICSALGLIFTTFKFFGPKSDLDKKSKRKVARKLREAFQCVRQRKGDEAARLLVGLLQDYLANAWSSRRTKRCVKNVLAAHTAIRSSDSALAADRVRHIMLEEHLKEAEEDDGNWEDLIREVALQLEGMRLAT